MGRLLTAAVILALTLGGSVAAESMGLGAPDTVDLVVTVAPDYTTNQLHVQLDLWVFSDSNYVEGATMGMSWDNPNMSMDSAAASQLIHDNFELGPFLYEGGDINQTNTNQRFLFGGAKMFGPGLPPADIRRLWATYWFTMSEWNECDSLAVDTLQFSTSTSYKFVGSDGVGDYFPAWLGPTYHRDSACAPPVNLVVNPDNFTFAAIEGGANPANQSIEITTDGDPVSFDVIESIPWATVNPIVGTTPQTGLVSISTSGLAAGTYVDSFNVTSAAAINSPVWVPISLTISEPPPEIAVVPSQLFFNAVAGEPNPASKTVTVYNSGGGTLNWSASYSSAWLTLSPTAGVDSVDVDVAVDISGLAFGEYYDTVVITDPAASNDPVSVPVQLSIGSDLPILEILDPLVSVVVDMPATSIPSQTFDIGNAGAGTLTFTFVETSPRIVSFDPDTGTAPGTVTAHFDLAGAEAGDDFYDTVWVHSNEAINSPQQMVFWFHFVNDPAVLFIVQDTLHLTLYECSMGYGKPLPARTFLANNLGHDNPVDVWLEFDSTDLFDVNTMNGILPEEFTLFANDLDLPVGDYYDSIWVHAPKAQNSPKMLVVAYHVEAQERDPWIYLPLPQTVVVTQENSGPTPSSQFEIWNKYGGCMPFDIQEDIPWAFLESEDGVAPVAMDFNVNSSGFPLGTYIDTFEIHVAEAANSPQFVQVTMHVFRYYGDVDWNGEINIADLVYLVLYMFHDGPAPMPARIVGSLNCDPIINIDDLVWMVEYMFQGGPPPCGSGNY